MNDYIKTLLLFLFSRNYKFRGSRFLSLLKTDDKNICRINTKMIRSRLVVKGVDNSINIFGSLINKCNVYIEGYSNYLVIEEGACLNSMFLAIVGNNCQVRIGKNSYFHSGYLYSGSMGGVILSLLAIIAFLHMM